MKGKRILAALLLILAFLQSKAQINLTYDSHIDTSLYQFEGQEVDSDGNLYRLFYTDSTFQGAYLLLKTDFKGKLIWKRRVLINWRQKNSGEAKLAISDTTVAVAIRTFYDLKFKYKKKFREVNKNNDTSIVTLLYSNKGKLKWYDKQKYYRLSNITYGVVAFQLINKGDSSYLLGFFYKPENIRFLSYSFVDSVPIEIGAKSIGAVYNSKVYASHLNICISSKGSYYVDFLHLNFHKGSRHFSTYKFSSTFKTIWKGTTTGFVSRQMKIDPTTEDITFYCSSIYDWKSVNYYLQPNMFDSLYKINLKSGTNRFQSHFHLVRYDSSGALIKVRNFKATDFNSSTKQSFVISDSITAITGLFVDSLNLSDTVKPNWQVVDTDTVAFFIMFLDDSFNIKEFKMIKARKFATPDNIEFANLDSSLIIGISNTEPIQLDPNNKNFVLKDPRGKRFITAIYDIYNLGNIDTITGPQQVCFGDSIYEYSVPKVSNAQGYNWTLPQGAQVIGKNNNAKIKVKFTQHFSNGLIYAEAYRAGNKKSKTKAFAVSMVTDTVQFAGLGTRHCLGDTISINSNRQGKMLYLFTNNTLADSHATAIKATSFYTGTTAFLHLKAKHKACYYKTNEVSFTVDTPIQVSFDFNDKDGFVCADHRLVIQSSGVDSVRIYNNGSQIFRGKSGNRRVFSYADKDVFKVVGKDSNNCITEFKDTINVWALPPVNAGNDTTICQGEGIKLEATCANSYQWQPFANNGDVVYPSQSRNYIVVGTSKEKCINRDTLIVTVNNLPKLMLGNDTSICKGNTLQLTGNTDLKYTWQGNYQLGDTITINSNQIIYATATDTNACVNNDSLVITALDNPNLSLPNTNAVCQDDSLQISATSNGTVSWNKGFDNGGFYVAQTSAYLVATASLGNGCITLDSFFQEALPLPNVSANDTSVCIGTELMPIAKGAKTYTWYRRKKELTDNKIIINQPEELWVLGIDSNNCKNIDTIQVDTLELPKLKINNDTSVCKNEIIILKANTKATVTWNNNYKTGETIIVTQNEKLLCIAQNQYGCHTKDSFVITALELPKPNLGIDQTLQRDDSLWLSPGSYSNYLWSNNSNDSQLLVSYYVQGEGVHIFSVNVSDENGCQNSDTVSVTILPNSVREYKNQIAIYPNPANDQLNIFTQKAAKIRIINTIGQIEYQGKLNAGKNTLQIQELSKGVKLVEIEIDGERHSAKLLLH